LLALGAGAYLLILLTTFPAARAVNFLQQQVTGLSLQSVNGTVFSGRAGSVVFDGRDFGAVHWSFRPAALLLGRLEYHVTFNGPLFQGSGDLGSGLGADFMVHELVGELQPDSLVNRYLPVPVATAGVVTLTLASMQLHDGFPAELSGTVLWTQAAIVKPAALSLGKLEITMGGTGDTISAEISNDGGHIAVSGDLSIRAAGQYTLQLLLKPGPETDPDFVGMLKSYARPQAGGAYLITESGTW